MGVNQGKNEFMKVKVGLQGLNWVHKIQVNKGQWKSNYVIGDFVGLTVVKIGQHMSKYG